MILATYSKVRHYRHIPLNLFTGRQCPRCHTIHSYNIMFIYMGTSEHKQWLFWWRKEHLLTLTLTNNINNLQNIHHISQSCSLLIEQQIIWKRQFFPGKTNICMKISMGRGKIKKIRHKIWILQNIINKLCCT